MRTLTVDGKLVWYFLFSRESSARHFANAATEPLMIVLGTAPEFWVTSPANATRLGQAGYEVLSPLEVAR